LRVARPIKGLSSEAAHKEEKDIHPLAGKLCEEEKPVSKGISGLVLDAGSAVRRVVDDRRWEMDDLVAAGEKPGEGIILFANFKRCATTETFVEDSWDGQRAFAKCHVGTSSQAAEGGDFEPMRVLVA
jgi:hypothetical protein